MNDPTTNDKTLAIRFVYHGEHPNLRSNRNPTYTDNPYDQEDATISFSNTDNLNSVADPNNNNTDNNDILIYSSAKNPTIMICESDNPPWKNKSIDCFPLDEVTSVKLVTSTDLYIMQDHRRVLQLVFMKLDFRMLLVLMTVSKYFNGLVVNEIARRRDSIKISSLLDDGFWSNINLWHMAKRCSGFKYFYRTRLVIDSIQAIDTLQTTEQNKLVCINYNSRADPLFYDFLSYNTSLMEVLTDHGIEVKNNPCNKWEEITQYGNYQLCRTCCNLKVKLLREENLSYKELIRTKLVLDRTERQNGRVPTLNQNKSNRYLPKNN